MPNYIGSQIICRGDIDYLILRYTGIIIALSILLYLLNNVLVGGGNSTEL